MLKYRGNRKSTPVMGADLLNNSNRCIRRKWREVTCYKNYGLLVGVFLTSEKRIHFFAGTLVASTALIKAVDVLNSCFFP